MTEVTAIPTRWTLPLAITFENRSRAVAGATAYFVGVYLATNHFHLGEAKLLEMGTLDIAMPFLPWTIWVYSSAYVGVAIPFLVSRDRLAMNQLFFSFMALVTLSGAIFYFFPTTYPRADFPTPTDLDPFTGWMLDGLRGIDTPANCAPSLHVSASALSTLHFRVERRAWFWPFATWTLAVVVSTMTTKQHYLVDGLSGMALALAMHLVFRDRVKYR